MLRFAVVASLVALLASALCHADDSGLSDEDHKAFAWFDGLRLPSTKGKPIVRVTTGRTWKNEDGTDHVETKRGFLIAESKDAFTVLDDVLMSETFAKSGAAPASFVALDLGREAHDVETKVRAHDPLPRDTEIGPLGGPDRVDVVVVVLGLARHCAENDRDGEAHALLQLVRDFNARSVVDLAQDAFDQPFIWRAVLDFGETKVSRVELLAKFRAYLASFPTGKERTRAKETVTLLERMVAEDLEHAKAAKPLDQMTKDERIAELVFRLRDAPGGQFMQPGSPMFFDREGDERWSDKGPPTPLAQLVAMSDDAVPALILAIEDERFTRTVGYWRDFHFSHYVLRVGDAARIALEHIAGRSFWRGTYTAASMYKDGHAAATRKVVEAWWKDVQSRGERGVLLEAVESGGAQSVGGLRTLLQKYPEDAAVAALSGLKAVTDEGLRSSFVQTIREIRDPRITDALVVEARLGPTLECRAFAAWEAWNRGRREVLAGAIDDWKRSRAAATTFDQASGLSVLVGFLAQCGAPDAVASLNDGIDAETPAVRGGVVQEIASELAFVGKRSPAPPESVPALEDILARRLGDVGRLGTWSSSRGSADVRVCDRAAEALSRRWNLPFDLWTMETNRDAAIGLIRTEWRKRRGVESPK